MNITRHGERLALTHAVSIGGGERWNVPAEVPIAIVFGGRNYAVMMGTPQDMADFAAGFALTERVVTELSEISEMDIRFEPRGVDVRMTISRGAMEKLDITQRRRNLVGSASCGLCGLDNAETLFRKLPQVSDIPVEIDSKAGRKAMAALRDFQPINDSTKSVHAAAWVSHDGDIQAVREDVGRHNALDKLLGHMARGDIDPAGGFVLMSSRCSYEIVEKAAQRGVQAILSISGPTHYALEKARDTNLSVYGRLGGDIVRIE